MGANWRSAFSVYKDKRLLSIMFFGFSSGLPLLLVGSTLSAWLRDEAVSLTEIGFISLVGFAYGLKFLWAPILDSVPLPYLGKRLGRRRSWLLTSQVVLLSSIAVLGSQRPSAPDGLFGTVFWAVIVAFFSASQDIVVDAYRTEVLETRRLGAGAAAVQFGYRIGMLVSGGGCLVLADQIGWALAYKVMASLMTVGIGTTLLSPEPKAVAASEHTYASVSTRLLQNILTPFWEFFRRRDSLLVLLFVATYRYGDALLGVMANPFYLDIGFSKAEIGVVSKAFGAVMTMLGTGLAGAMVARLGILRSLIIGGIFQGASNLMFIFLALVGHLVPAFALTIAIENVSGGLASGVFVAYLSSLCNLAFTATQYALLSSVAAMAGRALAAFGGAIAEAVGWPTYFAITTLAALPGLFFLFLMVRRFPPDLAKEF